MIPISSPYITPLEIEAVVDVLKSGNIASGKKVAEFEDKFARRIGVKHAIACNNGTSALHTALLSCGIRQGDEVIVPSFSFISTATAVSMCGATPIFADVHPTLYGVDVNDVAIKITNKTKAIMGVHLYGLPFDVDPFRDLCRDKGIMLIEDAAQAIGAKYKTRECGSLSDVACFSFYATKNITTGEGGMITTDNDVIADSARMYINHGQRMKYFHEFLGYNYRLTDIAAAIGIHQLERVDDINYKRRAIAKIYNDEIEVDGTFLLPYFPPDRTHVYHQYVIQLSKNFPMKRDMFMKYMRDKGIGTSVHYPSPIHKQPVYASNNVKLPISERLSHSVVSLPIYPSLSIDDIVSIASAVNEVVR